MQKLNFLVEAEINSKWVHAHVATLAQAKALLTAFESSSETIEDADIYITEDATEQARAEHTAYRAQQVQKFADKIASV